MIRVLLADDHPMIGSALGMLLAGSAFQLVGRAHGGGEAMQMCSELDPDVLLLDVNMPDLSGIEVLSRLRKTRARQKVVLLTAGMTEAQLIEADRLAPEGIAYKTSDPAILLDCLDSVTAGRRWVDPAVAEQLERAREMRSAGDRFTPRERELIGLVARGMRNRDIATRLGITEGTVKVYLHAIFEKAGVASRTELALMAGKLRR